MAYKFIDEDLDLVNENDEVIGKEKRSIIYKNKMKNFRAVNVFLVNDEGKIWIPRRVKEKVVFPLSLDASVGGHVASGETYEEAFAREVKEELNLDLKDVKYKYLGHLSPHKDGTSAFQKVYEIRYNQDPNFNRDDYITYYWLTPQEIIDRLEHGDKAKGDLPILIKKFYLNKK